MVTPPKRAAVPNSRTYEVPVRNLDELHSKLSEVRLLRCVEQRGLGGKQHDLSGTVRLLLPIRDPAGSYAEDADERKTQSEQKPGQDDVTETPDHT